MPGTPRQYPRLRKRNSWVVVEPRVSTPQDPWLRCSRCNHVLDTGQYERENKVCPFCGHHGRLDSDERIALVADGGSFEEWDADLEGTDPLDFPGYDQKLSQLREKTGLAEAVKTGACTIGGVRCAIVAMDSRFLMASMGGAVGEKIARAFERATDEGVSVVACCCSGGARMQEGLVSLMQMAKVSAAAKGHADEGLFYLSVITDPTTGGVTASFAMLGDVIISEPGALLGFAGRRVIENTIKKNLPDGFQTAEFALEHGLIDAIVPRKDLKSRISLLVALHEKGYDFSSLAEKSMGPRIISRSQMLDEERASEKARARMVAAQAALESGTLGDAAYPAWQNVKIARDTKRPTASYYISRLFTHFVELHGDRSCSDDPAIIAGIGLFEGRPVTVIAQEKGVGTAERLRRNFGCSNPEGYRKALRLAKEAQRCKRPIITIVDTQGAYCGVGAEERGMGEAIAKNLYEFSTLEVPVISVFIGEGGSGGALALAVADRVAMLENAVYSVLSPEGFASILWKDGSKAKEAAQLMKMTAADAKVLNVVDEIIPEPPGGAQNDPAQVADAIASYISGELAALSVQDSQERTKARYMRYRRFI